MEKNKIIHDKNKSGVEEPTTFQDISPFPNYNCPYSPPICPKNIHHYSMKCNFGFTKCKIKINWYDKYYKFSNLPEIFIGSRL